MDADELRHEVKYPFGVAFDDTLAAEELPPFPVLLEVVGESMSDVISRVQERYGLKAAEAWSRIIHLIETERARGWRHIEAGAASEARPALQGVGDYTIMAQLLPKHRRFSGHGAWRNDPQEVDTAGNLREAEYLVGEYQMSYGPTWKVWHEGG